MRKNSIFIAAICAFFAITVTSCGDVGPKGPQGEQGAQGEKGDKGDKGEQGLPGDKGETGLPGDKGEPGKDGAQGEQGQQGPSGQDGKSAFELYKDEFGYEGTQKDWLIDLTNGHLGTKKTHNISFNVPKYYSLKLVDEIQTPYLIFDESLSKVYKNGEDVLPPQLNDYYLTSNFSSWINESKTKIDFTSYRAYKDEIFTPDFDGKINYLTYRSSFINLKNDGFIEVKDEKGFDINFKDLILSSSITDIKSVETINNDEIIIETSIGISVTKDDRYSLFHFDIEDGAKGEIILKYPNSVPIKLNLIRSNIKTIDIKIEGDVVKQTNVPYTISGTFTNTKNEVKPLTDNIYNQLILSNNTASFCSYNPQNKTITFLKDNIFEYFVIRLNDLIEENFLVLVSNNKDFEFTYNTDYFKTLSETTLYEGSKLPSFSHLPLINFSNLDRPIYFLESVEAGFISLGFSNSNVLKLNEDYDLEIIGAGDCEVYYLDYENKEVPNSRFKIHVNEARDFTLEINLKNFTHGPEAPTISLSNTRITKFLEITNVSPTKYSVDKVGSNVDDLLKLTIDKGSTNTHFGPNDYKVTNNGIEADYDLNTLQYSFFIVEGMNDITIEYVGKSYSEEVVGYDAFITKYQEYANERITKDNVDVKNKPFVSGAINLNEPLTSLLQDKIKISNPKDTNPGMIVVTLEISSYPGNRYKQLLFEDLLVSKGFIHKQFTSQNKVIDGYYIESTGELISAPSIEDQAKIILNFYILDNATILNLTDYRAKFNNPTNVKNVKEFVSTINAKAESSSLPPKAQKWTFNGQSTFNLTDTKIKNVFTEVDISQDLDFIKEWLDVADIGVGQAKVRMKDPFEVHTNLTNYLKSKGFTPYLSDIFGDKPIYVDEDTNFYIGVGFDSSLYTGDIVNIYFGIISDKSLDDISKFQKVI